MYRQFGSEKESTEKIGDSEFTVKWLEEILREELNTQACIQDISFEETGFGKGMLSQILVVQLTWDTESDSLLSSVVLKIPTYKQFTAMLDKMPDDDPLKITLSKRGDMDKFPVAKLHKCEVAVYDLFHKNCPAHLKIPRYYFGRNMAENQQGVLVLEDLSAGFGSSFAQGLNRPQLMEMAEAIAALHSYSLNTEDWRKDAINVTLDATFTSVLPSPHKILRNSVSQMKIDNPELFDPLADKCLELCKSDEDLTYIYELNEKMGLPDVFCNGDLHAQNMMWMKDKDGKMTDELMAVFDWQTCHPGNIGEDFARLLTSSVPADIRRNHFMEVLEHYYKCLTKFLGSKPPYSFDQLLESYKRCFKAGMIMIVPGIIIIAKIPAFLGENPEEIAKELLERAKAEIEDAVAFEEEFA